MSPSTMRTYRLTRLAVICFSIMTILFVVSSSKPWAAGSATPGREDIKSSTAALRRNLALTSPAALTGKYTLNQFVYPGNTTFTSLSPTLSTTSSQINSWSIGVPILHVITIGNSDPTQTSLVNITLKDVMAGGLGANFVLLSVTCDADIPNGALCPVPTSLPPANTPLPLSIPNIKIKVGNSNDIVIRILGYYTAQNTFQNTFSVFETANPSTTEEQGPAKNVQINGNWSNIDLGLTKTSSTTSTSVSTTTPATIHYKLTLTGDSSQDFYPGNLLRIQDTLIANYPPLPAYTISNFTCLSAIGSTCPAAPSPSTPGLSISGANSFANTALVWPSGSSTVIKKGDTITMEFDVKVLVSACGSSSLTIQNHASIAMNGFTYTDANSSNNAPPATSNSLTTGLQPCPPPPGPPGTITKTRVCPSSGCPAVNWGDTVTYQIDVKNNTNSAQSFQVRDFVSKQSITVPLKATLAPSSSPTDVHCTPSTIACTTTPATTIPPQQLIADTLTYGLFQTDFTLNPSGSAGDSVTLTFDVKIDKLAECQTNPGNFFDNSTWLMIGNNLVASAQASPAVKLPDLSLCKMKVTKTLDSPANGVTFGQPVSYTITYENLDSQPVTVHTLRDALNMRDTVNPNVYGNIPITNLAANCTSTTGVSPMPIFQLGASQIPPSFPDWQGIQIIHEANQTTGITFPGNSKLQCTVSFTPQAPSATDNLCQGTGKPEIVNSAYMDVSGLYFFGTKPLPPYFAQVIAPLPLCRKVAVLKTIGNGVASTGPNGLLTFQIDVTNYGNDPVSNFNLTDPLPNGFTYVAGSLTCTPAAACAGPGFTGNTLNENFNPIPGTKLAPNNTVTLTFQVNAPLAGGTYPNIATGSFGAGPAGTNFYFEGDPAVLLVNSAQVQVLTPTLAKSFQPNSVAVNGNAVLTFTITNQTSNPAQTGMSFTDLLPTGVTVTSAPSTACGGAVSVSGGNSIVLSNAALASGQASCQFSVNVKASSCGTFVNDRSNFSKVTNLDVTNAQATLTVTGCPPPTESCGIKTNEISCNADGTGGYLYTFTVTNNTGEVVTDILLTPPANSGITLSDTQFHLSAGLANGASHTLQVTIKGGQPGQEACFYVTLMTKDGECCTTRVCTVLPECCGTARDERIECNKDGSYTYTMSIVNTGPDTIEHIYLYPPVGVTMTPNYFAVSLKPGDTFTAKVTITGAKPGDKLCFDISLHTANMEKCCKGQHCIVLPECQLPKSR